jgi:hypothetical protein
MRERKHICNDTFFPKAGHQNHTTITHAIIQAPQHSHTYRVWPSVTGLSVVPTDLSLVDQVLELVQSTPVVWLLLCWRWLLWWSLFPPPPPPPPVAVAAPPPLPPPPSKSTIHTLTDRSVAPPVATTWGKRGCQSTAVATPEWAMILAMARTETCRLYKTTEPLVVTTAKTGIPCVWEG